MIGYLEGTCIDSDDTSVTVLVGGVGYLVYCTSSHMLECLQGNPVSFWIELIAREQSLELFGFRDSHERLMFRMLLGVSGVGPRSALSILGLAPVSLLQQAICEGNSDYLKKVSGIGSKTAQKIVVELKDKVEKLPVRDSLVESSSSLELLEALQALGYHESQIRTVLSQIPDDLETTSDRVRFALQIIGTSL